MHTWSGKEDKIPIRAIKSLDNPSLREPIKNPLLTGKESPPDRKKAVLDWIDLLKHYIEIYFFLFSLFCFLLQILILREGPLSESVKSMHFKIKSKDSCMRAATTTLERTSAVYIGKDEGMNGLN